MKKAEATPAKLAELNALKVRPDGIALALSDEWGITPEGRAFPWDRKKASVDYRASLSADGEYIPHPAVVLYIKYEDWEKLECDDRFGSSSCNHTSGNKPAVRMSAEVRNSAWFQTEFLPKCKLIWAGSSAEIHEFQCTDGHIVQNAGCATEYMTTGTYNNNHDAPIDGFCRVKLGAVLSTKTVQVKATLANFRKVESDDTGHPGHKLRRGTREGYSTANSMITL